MGVEAAEAAERSVGTDKRANKGRRVAKKQRAVHAREDDSCGEEDTEEDAEDAEEEQPVPKSSGVSVKQKWRRGVRTGGGRGSDRV